jgi:nucleotide-binding universal stress UspA family protein
MEKGIRILVGIDGSTHSKKALIEAIDIAKKFSGFIKVINLYKKGWEERSKEVIEEAEHLLKKAEIKFDSKYILGSNPSRALVNMAEHEKFNLIVIGSTGYSSTAAFLLGSVSRQVVTKANCNVLVIKK